MSEGTQCFGESACRRLAVVVLVAALFAGCGSTPPQPVPPANPVYASGPIKYAPPRVTAKSLTEGTVAKPLDAATEQLVDQLLSKRFEVRSVEQVDVGRRVSAVYRGDAAELVDCGRVLPEVGGLEFPREGVAGARQRMRYLTDTERGEGIAERQVELSMRAVIELFTLDNATTSISMEREYVLNRVVTVTEGERVLERREDSIEFSAESTGRFGDGMTCVARDDWLRDVTAEQGGV